MRLRRDVEDNVIDGAILASATRAVGESDASFGKGYPSFNMGRTV